MKRPLIFFPLIVVLLAGCSLPDLSGLMPQQPGTQLPGEPPTQTSLPTDYPTFTATLPTPTFTGTPTPLGWQPTDTPQPTWTPDPSKPTATEAPTNTPSRSDLPTPFKYGGFLTVFLSERTIFWGVCKPNSTVVTATVEDPARVFSVILFVRLRDKKYDDETKWGNGVAMDKQAGGVYTYKLRSKDIDDYGHFFHAWILYQLVATDRFGTIVGRTQVVDKELSLEACP